VLLDQEAASGVRWHRAFSIATYEARHELHVFTGEGRLQTQVLGLAQWLAQLLAHRSMPGDAHYQLPQLGLQHQPPFHTATLHPRSTVVAPRNRLLLERGTVGGPPRMRERPAEVVRGRPPPPWPLSPVRIGDPHNPVA
jgi:hypothetical protein